MQLLEDVTAAGARREFASWLAAFLPPDYDERFYHYRWDQELRRGYQLAAFEAGWLMPEWPPELGGRNLGPREAMAVRVEAAQRPAPKLLNIQGLNMVARALRAHGTPEQQERHLVPTIRGEQVWAIGMSEPEAGSDLASLRTEAVPDGDGFVVTGQKVWTSDAHRAHYCTLYCRTDRQAPKHRGISTLIVDLSSPGIDIRPIRMASEGDEVFCEVFFDQVAVPGENLLGPLHGGWRVALRSLRDERHMIWTMNLSEIDRGLARLRELLDGIDPGSQRAAELARCVTKRDALCLTGARALDHELAGVADPPEALMLKLMSSELVQRTWALLRDVAGPRAATDAEIVQEGIEALGATIYGGTSEVQRNIVAERVLGLPR